MVMGFSQLHGPRHMEASFLGMVPGAVAYRPGDSLVGFDDITMAERSPSLTEPSGQPAKASGVRYQDPRGICEQDRTPKPKGHFSTVHRTPLPG